MSNAVGKQVYRGVLFTQTRCCAVASRCVSSSSNWKTTQSRSYANPANVRFPGQLAFKPPPSPVTPAPSLEDGHSPGTVEDAEGPFDQYLAETAQSLAGRSETPVSELYTQYRERTGKTIDLVLAYEERPVKSRRADINADSISPSDIRAAGDGLVMVVHALMKADGRVDKVCACSGFLIDAQPAKGERFGSDVVITCAHTLEEMHRNMRRAQKENSEQQTSFSFIIASTGEIRSVAEVLSSMPKSDVIALQLVSRKDEAQKKLRTLPVSPFPVYTGGTVLTHLFAASQPPVVNHSASRLPPSAKSTAEDVKIQLEKPGSWLGSKAYRRWGCGVMLGYRSYTGVEVEAGIHSSLPHILTTILPTPGSSGGPLVCAETGAVVGMISGRRMDNRIEGERGWGCSAEGIFEMFSLPGFSPKKM